MPTFAPTSSALAARAYCSTALPSFQRLTPTAIPITVTAMVGGG
jgi:hypothetical protein